MFDAIAIGDIKLDSFINLSEASVNCKLRKRGCQLCLAYGRKIPVKDYEEQIAGSAPNVAVGLSRLGFNSAVYSVMGDDETTDLAFKKLGREGVDSRYIEIDHSLPSSYSAVLNYKGERTILASHQPFKYRLPKLEKTKWIYVGELGDKYEDMYRKLIPYIKKNKIKLAFNPGAVQLAERKKSLLDLIEVSSILFVNRGEGERLAPGNSKKNTKTLIHKLWKMGPEIVALTDGKNGSYTFNGTSVLHCPIYPAKVVETTGAGDSFTTAFMGAILYEKKISDAIRWGNMNAASVIKYIGPQKGLLKKTQIMSRLRNHKNIKVKEL